MTERRVLLLEAADYAGTTTTNNDWSTPSGFRTWFWLRSSAHNLDCFRKATIRAVNASLQYNVERQCGTTTYNDNVER